MTGELQVRSEISKQLEAMVRSQTTALAELIPRTSVTPAAFMGFAVAAVNRADDDGYLQRIAATNPMSLMQTLMKCAMLGHVPGSRNFALVAFGGKNPAVQGIEQYHGLIDRAQRAAPGLVIAADVVRDRDRFERERMLGEPALHRYGPDGSSAFVNKAERGSVIGVYAQARLPQGSYTASVILTEEDIAGIRKLSRTDKFWVAHPVPMRCKAAILRIRGLPLSSEYVQQMSGLYVKAERIAESNGFEVPDLNANPDIDGEKLTDNPMVIDTDAE